MRIQKLSAILMFCIISNLTPSCESKSNQDKKETEEPPTKLTQLSLQDLALKVRPSVYLLEVKGADDSLVATGTGFMINNDGIIITNRHVIENAHSVSAKREDGLRLEIEGITAFSSEIDVVALKTKGDNLPFIELSSSEPTLLKIGDNVAVIGCPLGLEASLTNGIISAIRPEHKNQEVDEPMAGFIQITAPISSGSSGSPVCNMEGKVIGVATSSFRGSQNINFAIPSYKISNWVNKNIEAKLLSFKLFSETKLTEAALEVSFSEEFKSYNLSLENRDPISKLIAAKKLAQKFPQNYQALFYLGIAYSDLDLYQEAIESYQKALTINPKDSGAWLNIGIKYWQINKYLDSRDALKKALEIDPKARGAWVMIGESFEREGNLIDASSACRKELVSYPDDDHAWFCLGRVLYQQGKYDRNKITESIKAFERAAQLGHEDAKKALKLIRK